MNHSVLLPAFMTLLIKASEPGGLDLYIYIHRCIRSAAAQTADDTTEVLQLLLNVEFILHAALI